MRIIVDTSVIITHILSRDNPILDKLFHFAYDEVVSFATCDLSVQELKLTFQKPSIKRSPTYSEKKVARFVAWYQYKTTRFHLILQQLQETKLRDRTDEFYLRLAEVSEADYLLSYDKDLLVLKKHKKNQILRPEEWLKLLS